MAWQRVSLVVEGRFAEAIAEALDLAGAISSDIADADAGTEQESAVFAEPGADAPMWPRCRVSALFAEAIDVSQAIDEALESTGAGTLEAASLDRLDDRDWVRETQRQFEPIQAGERLWIVPTWHTPPEPGAVNLVLDPGAAFGTGSHPTTKLCLAWLERNIRAGDSVLDYGCGSGILAIAAALLGATSVAAVDIDPLALEAARYNSQRNNVSLDLRPAHQTLPSRYRVTVANILANPLRMLAPLLAAHTDPRGSIALSGILADQAGSVIDAYAEWCDLAVAGEDSGMGVWSREAGGERALMLITTCTHCLARFRVTPGQLNLKQGQVRCGHCNQVFSGFEALERFPDDDTGTRILAARAAAAAPVPTAADVANAPTSHPSVIPESPPELDDDENLPIIPPPPVDLEPIPLPDPDPEPEPVPVAATAVPVEEPPRPRVRPVNLLSAGYDPAPARKLSRSWTFGCALLLVLLAVEGLYAFRAQVAQNYPVTRPWLESACSRIGCRVPWINDPQLLKLEDSELLEVPGRPSEIALGARIRNLSPGAQEYPHLELTLTDLSGQAAARRVLRPVDYLGRATVPGDVLAPGSEISIQLRLETPRIKPTGYELLLFYP